MRTASRCPVILPELLCSVCVLYMQFSRFKWIVHGDVFSIDALLYTLPELWVISLLVVIPLLKEYRLLLRVLFYLYYYLVLCNFISWFVQGRTFILTDVSRAFELLLFYPEFVGQVGNGLLGKIILFSLMPGLAFLMLKLWSMLLPRFSWNNRRAETLIRFALPAFILVSTPVVLYANVYKYTAIAEIAEEVVFQYKVQQASREQVARWRERKDALTVREYSPQWYLPRRNIILFIIETAPFDVYPSLLELCRITDNSWLFSHGRLWKKHYATYPESERAIYSIVTGRYPPVESGDRWKENVTAIGLASFCNLQGYETFFLGTAPLKFHNDRAMVEGLGYRHIYEVKETLSALHEADGKRTWDRARIYEFDLILIEKARQIITEIIGKSTQTPFLLTIAPQASHAPFQLPPGQKGAITEQNKIRLNAIWQFKLLRNIVQQLEQEDLLNNTIVVVTGDHGIRSRFESPLFDNPGLLNSLSFHVPLMIAFDEMHTTVVADRVTSHIDIAPTLITMLSGKYSEKHMHGIDLFTRNFPQRDVYVLGGSYLPVTGIINSSGYYMVNRYLDQYFRSKTFDFSPEVRSPLGRKERRSAFDKLTEIYSMVYFLKK